MNTIKFLKLLKPNEHKFIAQCLIYKIEVSSDDSSVKFCHELKQFLRLYSLSFITNNTHLTPSILFYCYLGSIFKAATNDKISDYTPNRQEAKAILQDLSRNPKISQTI